MGYGSGEYTKGEYARTAAATLAYFLTLQRDAVGLVTFDDRVTEYLPPRYRPGHLHRLMAMLDREPRGPRDRPVRAAGAGRGDRREARADRPDLRPARPRRRAAHAARLPPIAGATRWSSSASSTRRRSPSTSPRRPCSSDSSRGGSSTSTPTPRAPATSAGSPRTRPRSQRACTDLGIDFQTITTDSPAGTGCCSTS